MRTALYIDDGRLQVVLTPETEQEKAVLKLVASKKLVQMYRGTFYGCRGGWTQWEDRSPYGIDRNDSLILVLDDETTKPVQP